MKIGVGITTYNQQDYFESLYNSLPLNKIDELVVVNGGDRYTGQYDCDWIQHNTNRYPSICRNDCITFLINKDCEHIFLIEDDMIIKDENIFKRYIDVSKSSGLRYFSFISMSRESGQPGARTPLAIIHYDSDNSVSLYGHMCNEFTYHHVSCFQESGLYDGNLRDGFDIDLVYRYSHGSWGVPFWWFPDITDSDEYIINNPGAVSRLQSSDHPEGSREEMWPKMYAYFAKKHGCEINKIPQCNLDTLKTKLKAIVHEENTK